MEPDSTGAATIDAGPALEIPSWGSDALDALIGDDYAPDDEAADAPEGGPADPSAQEPKGDDEGRTEDGTTDDTPATPEPDEPPKLKEIRSKLSRSEYGALMEHVEARAAERLKEATEAAERAQAAADAREAAVAEVRAKRGAFVGEVEGTREDGTPIPTYSELNRLLTTRNGDDVLDEKYGMSRHEALELKEEWDARRDMLGGAMDDFRTDAWLEMGRMLAVAVADNGLDIDRVWRGVSKASDVVTNVVATLRADHEREVAALRKDYEGRLRAATANGTAVAARTAARTMPTPETGGRGDVGGARIYTQSEIANMSTKEFAALEADIDRAYSEGRIRTG